MNHFTRCELCVTWSDVTEIVVTGPSAEPLPAWRDRRRFRKAARPLSYTGAGLRASALRCKPENIGSV